MYKKFRIFSFWGPSLYQVSKFDEFSWLELQYTKEYLILRADLEFDIPWVNLPRGSWLWGLGEFRFDLIG